MASDAPTPKNIGFIGAGIMGAQTPSLPQARPKPSTPKRHFTIRPASSSPSFSSSPSSSPELDAFDAFDALDALDALDASFPGRSSLSSPSPPRRSHGLEPDEGWP